MTVHSASAPGSKVRPSHFIAPVVLAILIGAVLVVVMKVPGSSNTSAAGQRAHAARKLPPYWTVKPGDTISQISSKTGLTIAQLEAFNPQADPAAIQPGQRLNLWRHPPGSGRPPKPLGPQFYTVRNGDSLGSIANDHHMSLVKLESLNPSLRPPVTLQPGDRVNLR